ncbi:MAG: molybdopterin-guanine dinucleotide biosynthesis protein B [Alphaproteobacteria bacterium GM7ARS4]|nr:molybdopterin-guanine dinucleotide biosynthesis protein B [Alphaproteobacteria bacterium GM7ARS4]
MKCFGIVGWSGSGKTTLLVKLIAHLGKQGFSVSTIKHAHQDFDIDKEGKDSYRHRHAGAKEVLVASRRRWALMHELRDEKEPVLRRLIDRMHRVDILLVEGFKREPIPKIELYRQDNHKAFLYPHDKNIIALACDVPLKACPLPAFSLDDIPSLASFIIGYPSAEAF